MPRRTRLWYAMWDAEDDDDATFERRLDSVVREIGERGMAPMDAASESSEWNPAPAPAPAPAPKPKRAVAPAPAPALRLAPAPAAPARAAAAKRPNTAAAAATATASPSAAISSSRMQTLSPSALQVATQPGAVSAPAGNFTELSAFLQAQREESRAERVEMESKLERQRAEMEARLEKQREEADSQRQALLAENTRLREEAHAAKIEQLTPVEAISTGQLEAAQGRVESLHAAQLLTDEELEQLEDILADFVELRAAASIGGEVVTMGTVHSNPVATRAHALVSLSEGLPKDTMLARQARRKLCVRR
jgi:hypothetical protein